MFEGSDCYRNVTEYTFVWYRSFLCVVNVIFKTFMLSQRSGFQCINGTEKKHGLEQKCHISVFHVHFFPSVQWCHLFNFILCFGPLWYSRQFPSSCAPPSIYPVQGGGMLVLCNRQLQEKVFSLYWCLEHTPKIMTKKTPGKRLFVSCLLGNLEQLSFIPDHSVSQ